MANQFKIQIWSLDTFKLLWEFFLFVIVLTLGTIYKFLSTKRAQTEEEPPLLTKTVFAPFLTFVMHLNNITDNWCHAARAIEQ